MSLTQILVQSLLDKKQKGLSVKFKTDGKKYFIYVANGLHSTMNKTQFNNFFSNWKLANSLFSK